MESEEIMDFTLKLNLHEVIMLQELTKDLDCGFTWLMEIAEGLAEKANLLYEKPTMTVAELEEKVQQEWNNWPDKDIAAIMSNSVRSKLNFYFEIEEAEDEAAKEVE